MVTYCINKSHSEFAAKYMYKKEHPEEVKENAAFEEEVTGPDPRGTFVSRRDMGTKFGNALIELKKD